MALRVAATAVTFALGGAAFGLPLTHAQATPRAVVPQAVPTWQHLTEKALDARAVAEALDRQRATEAEEMKWGKLQLSLLAHNATAAYDASAGKASDETRRALAVERNRATTAVLTGDTLDEVQAALDGVVPAIDKANAEVQAWEAAEAARKAEEERKAAEAAAAAAAAAKRSTPRAASSGSGAAAAAETGDPKAYLDGIAASFGTSIGWGPTACGHGSATSVAGCYTGGSQIFVNDAAYQSWSVAKGRGRNVVIHEAAHAKIMQICGTVYVSDRFENVTDAYAILLGAGATTGYGYNDADMQLARNIKDAGQCWS